MGDIASAELEQIEFRKARLSPLLKDEGALSKRRMHNICEQKKLEVAEALLNGEILYRKGMYSDAFVALKKGVDLDDNLPFDEPWGWMVPVRHALAALLLEQGEVVKAIVVYRQDLIIHPKNIWSLVGLRDCLLHRMDAIEDGENKVVMVDEVPGKSNRNLKIHVIFLDILTKRHFCLYCLNQAQHTHKKSR